MLMIWCWLQSDRELLKKIKLWEQGLETNGLSVNIGKTTVMKCQSGVGQVKDTNQWPCIVCHKRVCANLIECLSCKKWTHNKCSGVKGRLQKVDDYSCSSCANYGT